MIVLNTLSLRFYSICLKLLLKVIKFCEFPLSFIYEFDEFSIVIFQRLPIFFATPSIMGCFSLSVKTSNYCFCLSKSYFSKSTILRYPEMILFLISNNFRPCFDAISQLIIIVLIRKPKMIFNRKILQWSFCVSKFNTSKDYYKVLGVSAKADNK